MRPEPSLKFISTEDVYQAIEKCDSKKIRVTYCSLSSNKQCMTTKQAVIKITKIHRDCDFIEGVILKDNEPFEDIILKSSQILSLECVKGSSNNKPNIFDQIRDCRGIIRITQCTKLEQGVCKDNKTFPFWVSEIDERNRVIKGYKIKNNKPQYAVIDASLILRVDCLTPNNSPFVPFILPPFK